MPGKNKPKRLDRNRSWRVARRKKRRNNLIQGSSRNRKPRPKNKGIIAKVIDKVKSVVKTRNSVPSKLGTTPSVSMEGNVPFSSVARNSVPSKLGTDVPSSSVARNSVPSKLDTDVPSSSGKVVKKE